MNTYCICIFVNEILNTCRVYNFDTLSAIINLKMYMNDTLKYMEKNAILK